MSTKIAALEANGISNEDANAWIFSNINNPTLIFNTAKIYGLTSSDLASIVAMSIPNANSTLVEDFFDSLGFDSSELPPSDPILSDALIHDLIQTKIHFEDTRGLEILQLAAAADINSNVDGEAIILQDQAGYDEFIANYTRLDLENEANLISGDNSSYGQMFEGWMNEFSSVRNPVKAYYDNVIRLDFDLGSVLDLESDNLELNLINRSNDINNAESVIFNKDVVIFDIQANKNTIASFSDNDDVYIFDGKVHFLDTTHVSDVSDVLNWALSNPSQLSSNVTDFFMFDDGLNTHILGEKVSNQSYSNASNSSDFSIVTLTGVDISDLGYNDGFIAYA